MGKEDAVDFFRLHPVKRKGPMDNKRLEQRNSHCVVRQDPGKDFCLSPSKEKRLEWIGKRFTTVQK
jgi:hypothetical protein